MAHRSLAAAADAPTLEALQRITDAALAYLPEEELLQELLQRISDILVVDTVAFLLLEGDELRARAARGIEEEVEQGVRIPVGRGFAGRVAAQREPVYIPDVDNADIFNPILRQKGIRSLLGVPLIAEGEVIGVLHVGSLSPRRFTREETDLLQLAGDRAAIALEHTRVFERERVARITAQRAARQLRAVQRVTDAALAYLPQEELLQELLQRISDILAVDTVAILLLEGDDELHARAAKGIEEEVEQGVRIPLGRGFAGRIAAERRPVYIADVDHADILNPILRQKGIRSLLGVPLIAEGEVIGVLHVGSLTPRGFTREETDLLQLAGDRAALAIEQARLYEQRRIAELVQRRMLPTETTPMPGLEVAGRYLPAAGASLGGDWYDMFGLEGGKVALVVGDVVGHGVEAAAVMGQLRTAVRAYAADGCPPAAVVSRVNTLMHALGPRSITTLAYLELDPVEETLELVNAGHVPPLVVDAGGASRMLVTTPGPPLGAVAAAAYACERFSFPTGAMVLLYTDGLVEVRRESISAGLDRLCATASGSATVGQLAQAVLEHMVPPEPADDIAFVAARVPPLQDELRLRWPARLDSLAPIRHLVRRWLHRLSTDDRELYDILAASQEACANAIEHAYGPQAAEFEIELRVAGRRVEIVVRDEGEWRAPRGTGRGRGTMLMEHLMDTVDRRHGAAGTEVVLTRELKGPQP